MINVADFLRMHREQILEEWERRTLQIASSRGLRRERRRDHMPMLLDAMADAVERGDTSDGSLQKKPDLHAEERWDQNYELTEIVTEYRLLRRVILDAYTDQVDDLSELERERTGQLSALDENIDYAVCQSVEHYMLQRDRTRDFFIGMLSHDLRDPLNVIAMNAEVLLLLDSMPVAATTAAARIVANAQRMKALISDMLDVTRSRLGGTLPISPSHLDLAALVDQVVREVADGYPGRYVDIAVGEDCVGYWDPLRIGQVVSNLVSNALKHGTGTVSVRGYTLGEQVVLDVQNAGEVPEALRDRMFEPLVSTAGGSGVGLGLYIASEIARAHGGTLSRVDGTPGMTMLRLQLPKDASAATP